MAKYWEIRESYGDKAQNPEMEAYECGYEEGYQAAMEEMESEEMGQRSGYGQRSGHSGYRMGHRSSYGMRSGMRSEGEDRGSMGYRGSRR